jgi:DNA repair exonuclease SbcCD nuclease subunit
LLHGTFRGSFKGSEIATLKTNHAPIFSIENFISCGGPILMGHYHIPGCYEEYAYYNGSAVRFRFGEEQTKGFLVTAFNLDNRMHYTELIPIKSHSYITINIQHLIDKDPKIIIDYIKSEKANKDIDYIRVQFNYSNENMNIVRNYFRNVNNVKFKELEKKDKQMEQIDQEILEKNKEYSYILDNCIGDYDKFVMYVNQNEGYDFITTDELLKLLEDGGSL